MGDQRIAIFKDHWFEQNKKQYGHTPFNWSGKEAKLLKGLFQQIDTKNMDHKLVYKAVDFYFKQEGYEKIQSHTFGIFYNNFQKYLQAVMSTVTRDKIRPTKISEEKVDPQALRKFIVKQGPGYIDDLYKSKKFIPSELLKKNVEICLELFGVEKCKRLIESQKRTHIEATRKEVLLAQAKRLKETN